MNHIRLFIIFTIFIPLNSLSTVIVQGNDPDAPKGFLTPITAQTYDRLRGTFFVGLAAGADATNRFSISKAERPNFTTTPKFTPVLDPMSSLLNSTIEFLKFSQQAATMPVLVAVQQAVTGDFDATTIFGLFTNGSSQTQSTDGFTTNLNDAGGNETPGIVNIEANSSHTFAAVRPNINSDPGDTLTSFGEPFSGIALVGINPGPNSLNLNIKNATTGLNGNLATRLDRTSTVLKGSLGGADVIFTFTGVPMFWDDTLERLYIGVSIQTGGAAATDIAKSVVVGRLAGNALVLEPIAPDATITPMATNEIVVVNNIVADLFVRHLRVMHNTTGPDYLIINGGNGSVDEASNKVFALPLVNNPAMASIQGTLANKSSPLTNFVFTTPAALPGELPTENEAPAQVGAGNLPTMPCTEVADIVVINDTVYVSIAQAASFSPTATRDTGLFYSQAIFDNDGRIARWTPWTKRGVPFNAFPNVTLPSGTAHDGPVSFFEVDAKIGTVWVTEGETNRVVGVTNWGAGTVENSLPNLVNEALMCEGSYSVLDLDQATRGFLNETMERYALFGGANKVIFTRISEAFEINNPQSPQMVILDYSSQQNLLQTFLPEEAGCCQALEYSRTCTNDGQNLNYFFAGTETGLFVFTDNAGNGFNACTLSTLNSTPFNTRGWQNIATIVGSVIDIKTSGAGSQTLYVLVSAPTDTQPLASTLFAIPMLPTTAAMFAPGNIRTIAQTGVGVFNSVIQFYGIQIIATGDPTVSPEDNEQLILATNQGLFRSFANQNGPNGMTDAVNQAAANWQVVPNTNTTPFLGIAGMDTPVRQTVWPFSLQDQKQCKTFEGSSIHQTSGNGNTGGTAPVFTLSFVPGQFNAKPLTEPFETLDPINNFFSDGARRFFIFNRQEDCPNQNKLGIIPYTVDEWAVGQPTILSIGSLKEIDRFYWVKQIGVSGFLMAGTGKGVTALE